MERVDNTQTSSESTTANFCLLLSTMLLLTLTQPHHTSLAPLETREDDEKLQTARSAYQGKSVG